MRATMVGGTMASVALGCPSCSQQLTVEPGALHDEVRCARCGERFKPLDVLDLSEPLPALAADDEKPAAADEPVPDKPVLEGKHKLAQNKSLADREGAIAGLRGRGDVPSLEIADLMAALE